MRAPIAAPSRSPPGREKGRNERRKHKLRPCLTGSGTAGRATAASPRRQTDPKQLRSRFAALLQHQELVISKPSPESMSTSEALQSLCSTSPLMASNSLISALSLQRAKGD